MSQADVDIVLRGLDQLRASHESGAATKGLLDLCAPDVRVDASHRVFNPEVYEGRAGVERSIRDTCDAWEDFDMVNERVIDLGERVLVLQTISGRGRSSDAEVRLQGAPIWTVRGERAELIEVFVDQREALEAAGLDQEPDS